MSSHPIRNHTTTTTSTASEITLGTLSIDENQMVDVTFLIDQCASELSYQNPFICTTNFSLQDAMAALEIMDPKMDCCEIPASQVSPFFSDQVETTTSTPTTTIIASAAAAVSGTATGHSEEDDVMVFPRPSPQGLDGPILPLPWDNLTIRDVSWIGLESLSRLESFFTGASAVESSLTCLYLHNPVLQDMKLRLLSTQTNDASEFMVTERLDHLRIMDHSSQASINLENDREKDHRDHQDHHHRRSHQGTTAQKTLFVMMLAFLEITDVVRNICTNADIYEEEDFSANMYGIAIFADGKTSTESLLEEVVSMICRDFSSGSQDDSDHAEAILLILRFQLYLLTGLTTMASLAPETIHAATSDTKRVISHAKESLEQLQDIVKRIRVKESDSDRIIVKLAFDNFVNRPLVGNAPIRKVVFNRVEDSIPILISVVSEIDWAVCDLLMYGNTLSRIRRMLERVSLSSVNILSRSLIVLNLYFDEKLLGQHSMPELIMKHMKQLSNAPDSLFDETFGQACLNRFAKPVYDTLKLLTLNRNRQRAYMETFMLHEWAVLQQDAQLVDANHRATHELSSSSSSSGSTADTGHHTTAPMPYFFTHYVIATTLMLLDLHVTLGIEQKLFHGSHDLWIAYWYRDFLLSSLMNTMTIMRRVKLLSRSLEQQQQSNQHKQHNDSLQKISRGGKKKTNKNNNSKKGQNSNKIDNLYKLEDAEDEIDDVMLGVKRGLCRGLVRFMAALNQSKMVKAETYEFTSHELRFSKRFEVFHLFTQPPPLTYNDFCEGSDYSRVCQKDLVASATECFKSSKEMIDKLVVQITDMDHYYRPIQDDELRQLAKVCIGNSAFLQRLIQIVDSSGKATGKVSFDLNTHGRFCTIKIA